jgi:hypothetical protein
MASSNAMLAGPSAVSNGITKQGVVTIPGPESPGKDPLVIFEKIAHRSFPLPGEANVNVA